MTNLVILVGRIARDPETRTTQGGTSITSISVVTDRPARKDGKTYKDENGYTAKDSEFHRVTCFNGLGQNVAKYCTKGQLVTVEGRIHYTQWKIRAAPSATAARSSPTRWTSSPRAERRTMKVRPTSMRTERLPQTTRLRWFAPSGPFLCSLA